jgi:hypothetical protein
MVPDTTYHDFKLYQMDVKSVFLNGHIKEEVYVEQSLGFEDSEYVGSFIGLVHLINKLYGV